MQFNCENEQDKIVIEDSLLNLLETVAEETLKNRRFPYDVEVDMTIVDNDAIRSLNAEARHKDAVTDVLSFPMLDYDTPASPLLPAGVPEPFILGDIVISAERAKAQAEEYGHSFTREMAFLTVHSMLHLLGYDHETGPEDEAVMFALQEEILNSLDIRR